MFKALIASAIVSFYSVTYANELVYKADYSQMDIDATGLDICDYPEEFKIEASLPIATTFIRNALYTADADISLENIQATEGSISGGSNPKEYQGDYREKVYIVKQVIKGAYEPGIYTRVEVVTYGDKNAPTGLVVNSTLLNHTYSAELAEGANCGNIYYKLAN